MKYSKRLGVGLGILVLTAASITASALPLEAAAAASNCTSLQVISGRGSAEIYGDQYQGMGAVNFAAWQQIKSRVPDAQSYALPYEAVAIVPDTANIVANRYWDSIALGKVMLARYVDKVIHDCPNQRLAFLAYSQGAHVIADLLPQWGVDANIRAHIAVVLLFGDPRFNPGSPVDHGSFSKSRKGIWPSFNIGSVRTISSTWFPILRSYCDAKDFICNYSYGNYRQCSEKSTCGHFGYKSSGTAGSAGAWAGDTIAALPPLGSPLTGSPKPAPPAYYTYSVYHTGGVGLKMRAGANTGSAQIGVLPEGATLQIVCQAHGQRVLAGSDIWDRLTNGAWVYDWYTTTPVTGGFSPPIPQC
jgi:hypothetical protein